MADSLLYELSVSTPMDGEPFIRRDVIYQNDLNNGTYGSGNQIQYDLASIANSGMYASFSEAWIEIPLIMVMTGADNTATIDDTLSACAVGLKAGFHHLVDSISVQLNNTTIIQQTRLSNVYAQFRYVSQASLDDINVNGSTNLIIPDSHTSWKYGATGGSQNNFILPQENYLSAPSNGTSYNSGLYARDITVANRVAGPTGTSGLDLIAPANQLEQILRSSTSKPAGASVPTRIWNIMCQIKLKDLHSYFTSCPLMKNSYYKIYVNLNQCSFNFTTTANANASISAMNILGGGTCPVMVGCPLTKATETVDWTDIGLVDNKVYTVSCSVVQPILSSHAQYKTQLNTTRVYVPCYVFDPVKEQQYLQSSGREKLIKYSDIYQYNFTYGANSSYSQLVSNGISKLKSCLVVPFFDKVGTSGAVSLVPWQSPLASEPATTSPVVGALQTEYNVQISGINAYQTNLRYAYEHFLTELQNTGLNGNLTTGLTSSLISLDKFNNNYGYLYTDCSRRLGSAFDAPASVQLIGQNQSSLGVNFVCFLEFERSVKVDLFTGNILSA